MAKFATAGKRVARKDLALQAIAYGNVYVAQVAMGANPQQTLDAFREAEAIRGTSLILAYSQCIAHGIDMRFGMKQQDLAVASGYWPLLPFQSRHANDRRESVPAGFAAPDHSVQGLRLQRDPLFLARRRRGRMKPPRCSRGAQAAVTEKYRQYEDLAALDGSRFQPGVHAPRPTRPPDRSVREDRMDLTTRYMGLDLKNPLVASASPLNADVEQPAAARGCRRRGRRAALAVRRADRGGGGTLRSSDQRQRRELRRRRSSYFPEPAGYSVGPHAYLDLVRRASAALDIPVIASLNGTTDEGWISYASAIEEAGAKGLELNVYFIPADLSLTGARGRAALSRHPDGVRATVSIPVAVKLSPYFSAVGNMALALDGAGADALVLFNRFYQPDIDLGRLELLTDLQLSQPNEIRLPLLWLGVLSGRVKASLAATTGVTTADEVVKYLLVGADVVMTTSALLRHGVDAHDRPARAAWKHGCRRASSRPCGRCAVS